MNSSNISSALTLYETLCFIKTIKKIIYDKKYIPAFPRNILLFEFKIRKKMPEMIKTKKIISLSNLK
tara:strand:+ start:572 stop:772 length:201 start_codon:yes stop_codon:yes gene_type:complete